MAALGAALGAAGIAGLVQMGCGDDSSSAPIKSTPDATADGEAGGDSAPMGTGDAGGGHDATPDVGADGANAALDFAMREATAYCTSWLNCCPGGMNAGSYALQRCIDSNSTLGWEGNLPLDPRVYSRGHVTVDQAKAAGCIHALQSFPCEMQSPAQWGAITAACKLVITGTMPANATGCISSFECTQGNYCDPTVQGGTCVPLATAGQACNTKVSDPTLGMNPLADEMCSYLSSGDPPLFCDLVDNGPDAATCQPLLANGAGCVNGSNMYYDDQACSPPGLCGDNLQCGGTTTYPYASFCDFYRNAADAGGSD